MGPAPGACAAPCRAVCLPDVSPSPPGAAVSLWVFYALDVGMDPSAIILIRVKKVR